jgi:pantoate--beta-alanine ligase
MRTIHSVPEAQSACRSARREGKRVAFVPTMGALHDGHLSLVKAARAQSDFVVVSIFVNPLQFGPTEDFSKYPRMLAEDCAKLAAENVDLVFAPTKDDMYPANASTVVEVQGLSERLDGRSRPGHFKGVTTVVTKLFEIVRPELAFFGQKDAAQVAILRKMVADLNMDIQIVIEPTMREKDGLAMSSRNAYLNPEQRKQALVLHRALMRVQTAVDTGEVDAARLAAIGKEVIAEERGAKLDYFEVVNPDTLEPVSDVKGGALVAVAAWVGATRLIDNLIVHGGGKARGPSLG